MKVCFLTNTLDINSGWGRYSRGVINRIAEKKDFEVIVLTEEAGDYHLSKPALKNSFKGFIFILINSFKARRYIKQCDIIHCLDAYPYGLIGTLANLGLNKKLIISGIGSYSVAPLEQKRKRWLLKWAYQKADYVISISSFVEKEILKRVKLKNSQVVHLGVDFDKFQTAEPALNKDETKKIILSVGALKRRKGYHISIPAVSEVKKKYPHLKYYIVGSQDNQVFFNQLKDLVIQRNLKDNIIFLEKISDEELIKLYHQSDLFLLTSVNVGFYFEGFGLVYLEAGACGKPVIGTYNCGAEDAIKDGYNGLLVPQNDIAKTAKAVLKILDNPGLAQELGINGIKRAKEMSWQKTVEKYIKIYQSI